MTTRSLLSALRSIGLALTVLLCASAPAHSQSAPMTADTTHRFPSLEAENLEGQRFLLPAGFKGERNLILVAFQRQQQADVDSWTPILRTMTAAHPELQVYELPVLGRRYRLMRQFIDGGMRRGIPDAAVRAATITLYLDKSAFRRAVGIPDEERISLLLVDRTGRIHWRGAGSFSATTSAELAQELARGR